MSTIYYNAKHLISTKNASVLSVGPIFADISDTMSCIQSTFRLFIQLFLGGGERKGNSFYFSKYKYTDNLKLSFKKPPLGFCIANNMKDLGDTFNNFRGCGGGGVFCLLRESDV